MQTGSPRRLAIASDHAGVETKSTLVDWLRSEGHEVLDLGTNGTEAVDYPDYGAKLARAITAGEADLGIALCGSGIGIDIAVNRFPACRCVLVSETVSAGLARQHNDANVLALGPRLIGPEMVQACVATFLTAEFAGGRHRHRVDKLADLPTAGDLP